MIVGALWFVKKDQIHGDVAFSTLTRHTWKLATITLGRSLLENQFDPTSWKVV